jgi:hypothetical protein
MLPARSRRPPNSILIESSPYIRANPVGGESPLAFGGPRRANHSASSMAEKEDWRPFAPESKAVPTSDESAAHVAVGTHHKSGSNRSFSVSRNFFSSPSCSAVRL